MSGRIGVWIVGVRGGLATTVIVGCKAIARGLARRQGMVTDQPLFAPLRLRGLEDFVFGGHDIRLGTVLDSARQIERENGSLHRDVLTALADDLEDVDASIRPGIATNCGDVVQRLAECSGRATQASLREQIEAIRADYARFRSANDLERMIVINLASTEPPLPESPAHTDRASLEKALDQDRTQAVRASLLYAYAALSDGIPYVNFTPSNAAQVPALAEIAARHGVPFMGSDGKTGETLVKSALAPMFLHRDLRVLTWQGYNMLGDRDGEVLANEQNKLSKQRSKDNVVQAILGYPVHTHVGIDFVPSLRDQKTAFDFIHFEGFLGYRMNMSFTWQGCDAILAAPIVLDLVRLTEFAHRSGESGPMTQLACFFKNPHGTAEHDLHRQWEMLADYARRHSGGA